MNDLPKQNFIPGWPQFLDDADSQRYIRIRDGSPVSASPPLGNSCIYALIRAGTRIVEINNQFIPAFPWNEEITMQAGPWDSDELLKANGVPGLDPLPKGYEYAL